MRDIFREYGLFVMVTLVSATVWVVISYIMHWGGSNTALYANEDDSDALQNKFNITDIQEPRFVNFYITDNNGKNTANLRNVIGYNAPGTHLYSGVEGWKYRSYGEYVSSEDNWGIPYNTVYGYTAYHATGGNDYIFNKKNGTNYTLGISDYFSKEDIEQNKVKFKPLVELYTNQTKNGAYSLDIHVYRIFTDEEQKAIQSTYSAVTTNQVYSTNLTEANKGETATGYLYNNTRKHDTHLYITNDDGKNNLKITNETNETNKVAYGLYTKPDQATLNENDVYDVSYRYTDASKKDKVAGKATAEIKELGDTWVLEVKTGNHIDFSWTRDSSSGVAVIKEGTNELTDYDISTRLSEYMWNLADTIRIKFFLSTATSNDLMDYNNTLSKMIEAGDQKADITNKAVYLINTTFKYKLVYQYKNNLTGMKAEQAYTITVDSNNS